LADVASRDGCWVGVLGSYQYMCHGKHVVSYALESSET
jgi:hypothetical protein